MGIHIAGLCVCDATSPFDGMMVGLGSMQTGCEGVTGMSGRQGVALSGLTGTGSTRAVLACTIWMGSAGM